MFRKILSLLFLIIVGFLGGILGQQLWWHFVVEKSFFERLSYSINPYYTEKREVIIKDETSLSDVIEKLSEAIVKVVSTDSKGNKTMGFGVIITSDGLMITLNDLLPVGSNFSFSINNKYFNFEILKRDKENNISLVKLNGDNFKTIAFAKEEILTLGRKIFLQGENIINEGVIRSLSDKYIETNIYDNKETRGAPVFDVGGSLIGISNVNKEGRVILIPISKIRDFAGF
jgi:S1-C subfamily serine protease